MPTLAAALDLAKLEARNFRAHQLASAPASPVTGQLYYNTGDNTLYWYNGTSWVSASGGAGANPIGPAGGDLSGTYPNPQIAAGVITDADVAAANKDGLDATPSLRTLGGGTQQAMPGVRRLNQIQSPDGPVDFGGYKLTNLATPTTSTDAATKAYADSIAQGLDVKPSCRVATTANISLSGTQTIDGVVLAVGNRVLVKNQTTPSQNGLYFCDDTPWQRVTEADSSAEVTPGMFVFVEEGTTQADSGWVLTTNAPITLGTTGLTFTQFSGAGEYIWGNGLVATGNQVDVAVGNGLALTSNSVYIPDNGITNQLLADGAVHLDTADVTGTLPVAKGGTEATTMSGARASLQAAGYYSQSSHAAGTSIVITPANHGLGVGAGKVVQVQSVATGAVELADVVVATDGTVTVTFGASVSINTKRITIVG